MERPSEIPVGGIVRCLDLEWEVTARYEDTLTLRRPDGAAITAKDFDCYLVPGPWHAVKVGLWWYVHRNVGGDTWEEAGRYAKEEMAATAVERLNARKS